MNAQLSLWWQDTIFTIRTALRSSVAKNAVSLYVIQFANYILPLITVPYLVRVLGPAGFGVVAFG
ncbi:MAG: oligosaccharide flippase family protein [Anaerolineae bacterium]